MTEPETGIIVFGHTRPLHLKDVLESLRRQGTGLDVHVWLDGHRGRSALIEPVEKTRKMVGECFPEFTLQAMHGHYGIEKLTLDGLTFMSERYGRIIVLEDDCFPNARAVEVFEATLDSIENRPDVFSAYGHHFLTPSEGETITRFQGWGWATTTRKLLPLLQQARERFAMPEPGFLKWVQASLTPEVRGRLDVTPGRSCINSISRSFCWDGCLSLLTAQRGLLHKRTPVRVIYNCGMGDGGGHFSDKKEYRHPPFNMISRDEVWDYFEVDGQAAAGASAGSPAPSVTADALNIQGEELFARCDFPGAENAFIKALEIKPGFAAAHNNLGVLYWQNQNTECAMNCFKKALSIDPKDPATLSNYSDALSAIGRYPEAMEAHTEYLEKKLADSAAPAVLSPGARRQSAEYSAVLSDAAVGSPPPFLVNSLPKSGTNLLSKAVSMFPGIRTEGMGLDQSVAQVFRKNGDGGAIKIPIGVDRPRSVPLTSVQSYLRTFKGGDFINTHVPYSEAFAGLLQNTKMKMLLIIRDPRDVVVSHANFLMSNKNHFLHPTYRALSASERILRSITGLRPADPEGPMLLSIDDRYRSVLPWAARPFNYTTFFEKLIGREGGGSSRVQLNELRRIARHLGIAPDTDMLAQVASRLFGNSPTFHKGAIGSWRDSFSEKHKHVFKEIAGELLIELGYETDYDW